jgi:hypothetical protein
VLIWFAPLVLIVHTLVTAFVPAPILLLSQHEHIVIGKISAEAWIAHNRWHLKQVNGHFVQDESETPVVSTGNIISAKGCDLQALQAYYAALRGALHPTSLDAGLVLCDQHPEPAAPHLQPPDLLVPHPPPRF